MNTSKSNPKNDRVKRDYLVLLKEARQRSPATVDQVRHAIDRLEAYTGFKDFRTFNKEQAIAFKRALVATKTKRSDTTLSIATVHHVLQAIKDFLAWLSTQPGYRRQIRAGEIAYLNLTTGEERQARTCKPKDYPSVEEFLRTVMAMPGATELDRRDRAIMALLLLTGMRDTALIGLKMRDVDIGRRYIFQDPRHVETKFRKPIHTFLLPIGQDMDQIFFDWIGFLQVEKKFAANDPVFPKTEMGQGQDRNFAALSFSQEHWANAGPIRRVFREAFSRSGLSFSQPHTVRNTLVQFAYQQRFSAEQMKALSQNLGHESPMTTFGSYGPLSHERQGEVIAGVGRSASAVDLSQLTPAELARALSEKLG